jgi:tetratricopeptide (TPR) repeat protein
MLFRRFLPWLIVLALVFTFEIQSCSAQTNDETEVFARGIQALEAHDYNTAITNFTKAIRLNPEDFGAHVNRGLAYAGKGYVDLAVIDYTQAIHMKPDNAATYSRRADAFLSVNEYTKAIADYTEAIHLNPKASYFNSRAKAYLFKGEYSRASADYERATQIDRTCNSAVNLSPDGPDAISNLTEIIAMDPTNSEAYYNRGIAYNTTGDYLTATIDFSEAIRLGRKTAETYVGRGTAYVHANDYDRAVVDFDEAIRIAPNSGKAYYGRGFARLQMRQIDKAITDFTEAIHLGEGTPECYGNRASAFFRKHDYTAAVADFEENVQLAPQSANGHNGLAWILAVCPDQKVRNGKKAVEHALEACELTQWRDANYLDTLAAAYAESGSFEEAVRWQEKCLELNVQYPADAVKDARDRLDLYKQKMPYRKE